MTDLDGDDMVYASILSRVKHSELHEQMNNVLKSELRLIKRHVRHALSSLAALQQLQAAAKHLRPNDTWLPTMLQAQLEDIEKKNCCLDTMMIDMEMDRRTKKKRRLLKRKRVEKEDRDEVDEEITTFVGSKDKADTLEKLNGDVDMLEKDKIEIQDDEEFDAKALETAFICERAEMDRVLEDENEASDKAAEKLRKDSTMGMTGSEILPANEEITEVEKVTLEIQARCGDEKLNDMRCESNTLSNGLLVMPLDTTVGVKKASLVLNDVETLPDDERRCFSTATNIVKSPLELKTSKAFDKIAVRLEMSEVSKSTEVALSLEVPDSESDDDEFSLVQETVTKLKKAEVSTQLLKVPVAVGQLRTYLFDRKYLTIVKADAFLFAHKRITDEEAKEIGYTIETIILVAMTLPKRLSIKLALYDLLIILEQLELTLGALPEFLRPATTKLYSYFASPVETVSSEHREEAHFVVFHV